MATGGTGTSSKPRCWSVRNEYVGSVGSREPGGRGRVVLRQSREWDGAEKEIMAALLVWIRRIIQIGVLTFLSKLGFKTLFGLVIAFLGLVALVVLLLGLLLGLMF